MKKLLFLLGTALFLIGCTDDRMDEIEKEYQAHIKSIDEEQEKTVESAVKCELTVNVTVNSRGAMSY